MSFPRPLVWKSDSASIWLPGRVQDLWYVSEAQGSLCDHLGDGMSRWDVRASPFVLENASGMKSEILTPRQRSSKSLIRSRMLI